MGSTATGAARAGEPGEPGGAVPAAATAASARAAADDGLSGPCRALVSWWCARSQSISSRATMNRHDGDTAAGAAGDPGIRILRGGVLGGVDDDIRRPLHNNRNENGAPPAV
jgi:hypothetical protein